MRKSTSQKDRLFTIYCPLLQTTPLFAMPPKAAAKPATADLLILISQICRLIQIGLFHLAFFLDRGAVFFYSSISIKSYVYAGMPEAIPKDIMRHKSKIGYVAKNINQLMKVKREINEITDIAEKLCDVTEFCDGSYNSLLDELSGLYEVTDYCNVVKNFIIYDLYCCFMRQRSAFNKKVGITVKGNHDRAEKCIADFRKDTERILEPVLSARKKQKFVIDKNLLSLEVVSDCSAYKVRSRGKTVTMNVAHNSYIAFLDMYADLLSTSGKIIDNCEICGQLFVADRANYAPVCSRTTCKQTYQTKINTGSRERARKNPANDEYIKWDDKCANYRKKLIGFPEQLTQYDTAREKLRDKLKKAKKGLTKNSRNEDLENYIQMCFDAAVDLQDLSKSLKEKRKAQD